MPNLQDRRVCLAIGVANAKPLDWLPGAATAARDIAAWARCSGFDAVTLLTDQAEVGQTRWTKGDAEPAEIDHPDGLAVTIPRIKEELLRLLPAGELTHWLVLHFAGHGLRQDSVRTLWLPTDWERESRAIAVEALKASLESYGIENLTLVSDACRDFANRPSTANLAPDPVVGRGPVQPVQPGLDRFNAVEDGKAAFMIPGKTAAESVCILSGSLANALWGHEPKAFSDRRHAQIDSDSLLRFISVQTGKVGELYGLESQAEVIRGYGRGAPEMIYFDGSEPPAPLSPPIVWPPPGVKPQRLGIPAADAVEAAIDRLGSINLPGGAPPPLGPGDRATALDHITGGFDLAQAIEQIELPGLTASAKRMLEWQAGTAAVIAKQGLERAARQHRRSRIRRSLRSGQRRISWDANLIMTGGQPVAVWAPSRGRQVGLKSWMVDLDGREAVQLIVEYADGLFAPVVLYAGLATLLTHDGVGRITGWMCAPPHATDAASLALTNGAIAELQTTRLSPGAADRLAASLRHEKHANPMLGAIAAYLYDYTGDRDNIRRMAYYYASQGQPIPYDVALLGLLETRGQYERVIAHVPPVQARPDGHAEGLPNFARRATGPVTGPVAGFCPWLRQGWDYVASPEPVEEPLTFALQAALPFLLNSSFTALSREGALALVAHFGLEAQS